jgi:hypothetical protein
VLAGGTVVSAVSDGVGVSLSSLIGAGNVAELWECFGGLMVGLKITK